MSKTEFIYKCDRLTLQKQHKCEFSCRAHRHCDDMKFTVLIFATFNKLYFLHYYSLEASTMIIPGPTRQELARTMADNTSSFQSCRRSFNLCSTKDNRFCTTHQHQLMFTFHRPVVLSNLLTVSCYYGSYSMLRFI